MKKTNKLEKPKDQIFNPINLFLIMTVISGFLYISDINIKNSGKQENLYSSLEKFVIERVVLF